MEDDAAGAGSFLTLDSSKLFRPPHLRTIAHKPHQRVENKGDKVVLIEDEAPNGTATGGQPSEERRLPTVIQAGGGTSSVGGVVAGSRRRPLSSRISKANRELHGADSYSQIDQFDNADDNDFDDNDRDS